MNEVTYNEVIIALGAEIHIASVSTRYQHKALKYLPLDSAYIVYYREGNNEVEVVMKTKDVVIATRKYNELMSF